MRGILRNMKVCALGAELQSVWLVETVFEGQKSFFTKSIIYK
jgi:hypothetical protein